jgi:hypothetical protein
MDGVPSHHLFRIGDALLQVGLGNRRLALWRVGPSHGRDARDPCCSAGSRASPSKRSLRVPGQQADDVLLVAHSPSIGRRRAP